MPAVCFSVDFSQHKLYMLVLKDSPENAEYITRGISPLLNGSAQDFAEVIQTELKDALSALAPVTLHCALPQEFVGLDIAVVPALGKSQTADALKTELASQFKGTAQDFEIKDTPLHSDKLHSYFLLLITPQKLLSRISSACSAVKFPLKGLTFGGAAVANAAMLLRPELQKRSVIVVNVGESRTTFSSCKAGKLRGAGALPIGFSHLSAFTDAASCAVAFAPVLRHIAALRQEHSTHSALTPADEVLVSIPARFNFLLENTGVSAFNLPESLQGALDLYGAAQNYAPNKLYSLL